MKRINMDIKFKYADAYKIKLLSRCIIILDTIKNFVVCKLTVKRPTI